MVDDAEARIRRALAHVAPSPAADADLAGALASAARAHAPAPRRSLWIGVAAAAALIAAVGIVVVRRDRAGSRGTDRVASAPLDGRTVRVHVDADGVVELDDLRGAPRARIELGGTPTRASDGLAQLERALIELTAGEPRETSGVSTVVLELVPDIRARWRWMQWILAAATNPKAQVATIRFGAEGSDEPPIMQRLPGDQTHGDEILTAYPAPNGILKVLLLAGVKTEVQPSIPTGGVRVEFSGAASAWFVDLESSPAPGGSGALPLARAMAELTASFRAAAADASAIAVGEIDAPLPGGDAVTYEAVHAVLRAFHEAGVEDVMFGGAARPK